MTTKENGQRLRLTGIWQLSPTPAPPHVNILQPMPIPPQPPCQPPTEPRRKQPGIGPGRPCRGAQGPRGTVLAQPSAASPGGCRSGLLTLSLSSSTTWGHLRGRDRDQTCEQIPDPERPAGLCWCPEGLMPRGLRGGFDVLSDTGRVFDREHRLQEGTQTPSPHPSGSCVPGPALQRGAGHQCHWEKVPSSR